MTNVNIEQPPYKVVVWGPGGIGKVCMRYVIDRPEFELVGVLCYSESKVGQDAGTMLGRDPIGVVATNDQNAILALNADVVLWCGLPTYSSPTLHDELYRILESGKNVISPAAFHYVGRHDNAYAKRLEEACRKGNSSAFGTGVNPGYWFDRVIPTLTGVCMEVESLFLDEYADCGAAGSGEKLLYEIGFGQTPEEASKRLAPVTEAFHEFYYGESMDMVAFSTWGRHVDRFETHQELFTADKDILLDTDKGDPISFTIPEGGISGVRYTITGYIDDQPRVKTRVNWFLRPENSPFPVAGHDYWDIEIEAKPVSIRSRFNTYATLKGDLEFHPGEQFSMAWYATVVPMIQAIPIVVAHEPGPVNDNVMANCVPDFRTLATRKSLADL